jgi:HPt (histidine-containing phosphotransfer) domain-containing protein
MIIGEMSIFDQSKLRETCGDDPEFCALVLDEFVRSGREGLDGLGEALLLGDTERAYHALHTLKGSARTVGAEEFATISAEWEARVAQDGLAETAEGLGQLEEAWDRLITHLAERREAA